MQIELLIYPITHEAQQGQSHGRREMKGAREGGVT